MREKILLSFVLVAAASWPASSQIPLTAGDRCTCPFSASNFIFFPPGPGSFRPVYGEMVIRLSETTLPGGTVLRYEMFENGPGESPICSGLITSTNADPSLTSCNVSNAWSDLQGTVRVTMVSGSATVLSISLQVRRFLEDQYQNWVGGVAPVVEPRLSIASLPNAQAELSWSTNQSGFALETSPTLLPADWTPVTNNVATVGARFSVVVNVNDTYRLFRLRKS